MLTALLKVRSAFATMVADMEGIGYPLADLARIYQGQDIPSRPNSDRLWLAAAALRGGKLLPSTPVSGNMMLGVDRAAPSPPPPTHILFHLCWLWPKIRRLVKELCLKPV